MSVLGKIQIINYLKEHQIEDRLIIAPLLEESQIGDASIDLRLGNDFIVTRRGNLPSIDPKKESSQHRRYQAKHHINFGDKFYLHPGELVLAGTLEYIRIPKTIAGYVTSRSRWGRVGLVIATATAVAPGFVGSITLELVNHGEVPLVLYPGLRVSQLVLEECEGGDEYSGAMACYTGPQYGDVSLDSDIKHITSINK